MCKNVLTTSLVMFLLIACSTAIAQQQKKALSNADVIAMVKAGLPENTVILAIQQGSTGFDTSALKLIELKNQGISPKILDAMIQAGNPIESPRQANVPSRTASTNPLSPDSETNEGISYGDVVMLDGAKRTAMTRGRVDVRTGGLMKQMVNPFGKTRLQGAINGNHSQLRTTNTSPMFEVAIASDLNASDYVALVKLKAKSDRREIEVSRASITSGISSGFRKEDIIPVTLEELQNSAGGKRVKSYRIKPVTPVPPGEYALAVGSALLYDFGIDSSK